MVDLGNLGLEDGDGISDGGFLGVGDGRSSECLLGEGGQLLVLGRTSG